MQYTIKAKPTLYKGIPFRSRLEARWAAFFDLLKWEWEYEPCDFNGWYPDFVIYGNRPIYVEVKPVIEFPEEVAKKMEASLPNDFQYELLILGQRPIYQEGLISDSIFLGWLTQYDGCPAKRNPAWWELAPFGKWEKGGGQIGFCHSNGSFSDRISGGYDGGSFGTFDVCGDLTSEVQILWGEAHQSVRFKKNTIVESILSEFKKEQKLENELTRVKGSSDAFFQSIQSKL